MPLACQTRASEGNAFVPYSRRRSAPSRVHASEEVRAGGEVPVPEHGVAVGRGETQPLAGETEVPATRVELAVAVVLHAPFGVQNGGGHVGVGVRQAAQLLQPPDLLCDDTLRNPGQTLHRVGIAAAVGLEHVRIVLRRRRGGREGDGQSQRERWRGRVPQETGPRDRHRRMIRR